MKKKISGRGPAWLQVNESRDGWLLRQDRVQIVHRIFQESLQGRGHGKIAEVLTRDGVKTMEDAECWTEKLVGDILNNHAVYGQFKRRSTGEVFENYYPAVINKADFDATRSAIANRQDKGGAPKSTNNLFAGIGYCMLCGSRMQYLKPTETLRCMAGQANCEARPFPYPQAEAAVLDRLINKQGRDLSTTFVSDTARMTAFYKEQIAHLQQKQASLTKRRIPTDNFVLLAQQLLSIQEEIESVQAQLAAAPLTGGELDSAGEMFAEYQQANPYRASIMRRKMKTAVQRQVQKFEFVAGVHATLQAEYVSRMRASTVMWRGVEDSPRNVIRITYAGGTVRLIDADKF